MAATGSAIAARNWTGGATDPVCAVNAADSKGAGRVAATDPRRLRSLQTERSARPCRAVAGPHRWEGHERAHGGAALVAWRHPVPDLRPLLAGQRRRRVRRPAGGDIRARLAGVARRGRHLAVADDAFPRSRLGLR